MLCFELLLLRWVSLFAGSLGAADFVVAEGVVAGERSCCASMNGSVEAERGVELRAGKKEHFGEGSED